MTSSSDRPLTESSPCQPDTPYGRSKLQAEQAIVQLASQSAMTWTILRPPLVYGAGNPGNMERLIKLVQTGLPLPFGAVKNRRSLIYVGSLVDAIASTLNHPQAANQTFLVSDGEDLSTPELIQKIAVNLKHPCNMLSVPPSWLQLGGKLGDTVQNVSKKQLPLNTSTIDRLLGSLAIDSSYIQKTLNWQPPFTVDAGLAQMLRSPT
jgi:nucleoside-diphosphate-sugar epimerase